MMKNDERRRKLMNDVENKSKIYLVTSLIAVHFKTLSEDSGINLLIISDRSNGKMMHTKHLLYFKFVLELV